MHVAINPGNRRRGALPTWPRLRPLARSMATLLALTLAPAFATNRAVTSCADSGAGSLRAVLGAASTVAGDTVDMSSLTACPAGKITLTTGGIEIDQTFLTLHGPGADLLTITATPNTDLVFDFEGLSTLTLDNLSIADASPAPDAVGNVVGGCIYASGSVSLSHVHISGCKATTTSATADRAEGAGLVVAGDLTLTHSVISGNSVTANGGGSAFGGGAAVFGALNMSYSTLSNNSVSVAHAPFTRARGGGIYLQAAEGSGSVNINNSTISGNSSAYLGGGLMLQCLAQNYTNACSATVRNSTISGNTAVRAGGVYSSFPGTFDNSSIVNNLASASKNASPGLTLGSLSGTITVRLRSSLLANNAYLPAATPASNDLQVLPASGTNAVTLTATSSLVRAPASGIGLAPGNLSNVCPQLGPLRNNGGETHTHALLSGSIGLDAGANPAFLNTDQRGTGYARLAGSAVDIGAYELDPADIIFDNGLDGCP